MTDQQIIEYLRQEQHSAAVKGLYSTLPLAKKYIQANNGTANDAQDIFQDALVILFNKVRSGNFTLTVPLKTYLLAVVKNCWLHELRQRKKLPLGETENDPAATEATEGPEFLLAKAAFHSLGDKCRQLLMMFYFGKKDYKTIAASLSFSDEKVAKNQKYRCLQKAKENYINLLNNSTHG